MAQRLAWTKRTERIRQLDRGGNGTRVAHLAER